VAVSWSLPALQPPMELPLAEQAVRYRAAETVRCDRELVDVLQSEEGVQSIVAELAAAFKGLVKKAAQP